MAVTCHMRDWVLGTPAGEIISMAIVSDGSYGVDKGLVFSFPLTSDGAGAHQIVPDLELSPFALGKIQATAAELREERDLIADLLT